MAAFRTRPLAPCLPAHLRHAIISQPPHTGSCTFSCTLWLFSQDAILPNCSQSQFSFLGPGRPDNPLHTRSRLSEKLAHHLLFLAVPADSPPLNSKTRDPNVLLLRRSGKGLCFLLKLLRWGPGRLTVDPRTPVQGGCSTSPIIQTGT